MVNLTTRKQCSRRANMRESYEVARANIALFMEELRDKYGMTEEETRYKIVTIGNKKVIIKISEAIKKRIDRYLRHDGLQHALMEFFPGKEFPWEAVVQADGAESAIFESILYGIIKREEKAMKVRTNNALLEKVLIETIQGMDEADRAIIAKTKVFKNKNKQYVIKIKIKCAIKPFTIVGTTEALDLLTADIRNKVPEWIKCCRELEEKKG
jgi:hypothetical protein